MRRLVVLTILALLMPSFARAQIHGAMPTLPGRPEGVLLLRSPQLVPFAREWTLFSDWQDRSLAKGGRMLLAGVALTMGLPGNGSIVVGVPVSVAFGEQVRVGPGAMTLSVIKGLFYRKKGGGVAIGGVGTFPTSRFSRSLGGGQVAFAGLLFGTLKLFSTEFCVNVGMAHRRSVIALDSESGSELVLGAQLRVPTAGDVAWHLEGRGTIPVADTIYGGEGFLGGGLDFPILERARLGISVLFEVPKAGMLIGIRGGGSPPPVDGDGDGVGRRQDLCPVLPEDIDGFEDGDGCPDPDNDRDGFPDGEDRCPLQPAMDDFGGGC